MNAHGNHLLDPGGDNSVAMLDDTSSLAEMSVSDTRSSLQRPRSVDRSALLRDPAILTYSMSEPSGTFGRSMFDYPPLPPNVVKVTNRPSTASEQSNSVLFVYGATKDIQKYLQRCIKKFHKEVARASHQRDKETWLKTLIHRIYKNQNGALYTLTPMDEWTEMPYPDVEPRVWDFLKQKCFVALNRDRDVVSGRGSRAQKYLGHQRYLSMRDRIGAEYTNPDTEDRTKKLIAESLVHSVYATGGHFLTPDKDTGLYYIVDDASATMKAQQALRDYHG